MSHGVHMPLFGKRKSVEAPDPAIVTAPASPGTTMTATPPPAATAASGLTDLHNIAARGSADDVRTCLAAGADVNEPNRVGYTPLSIAASRGDVEVATALLDAGAEVDATDKTGTTALAAAVLNSKGHGEMIQLLLARGADPDKPNRRGQTPLELAGRITSSDVVGFFQRS